VSTRPQMTRARRNRLRVAIPVVLGGWVFIYNLLVKQQEPLEAFFRILDTVSDDFMVGTALTFALGIAIAVLFSFTKLYTQIISNVDSFRILEEIYDETVTRGDVRGFFSRLLHFSDESPRREPFPSRIGGLLFAFGFIYLMSWIYVVMFSEALFFVAWSAGVDLPITPHNLLLMPTLALAIPFSARVMAYLRYPHTQDYADLMPGAAFVLLIVATLGYLFQSDDQKFFLTQVYENPSYLASFAENGAYLAFIPVFFEGGSTGSFAWASARRRRASRRGGRR
jgi:hypothetical protein